jgi:hypothetical protein
MKKLSTLLALGLFSLYSANAADIGTNIEQNFARGTTATLTGLVWYDENSDGIQNEADHGIARIKVHLLKDGDDTGEEVETNPQGEYKFENLDANHKYSIKIDRPKNYPYFTIVNEGDDESKDSDIQKDSISDEVLLKEGEVYTDLDAGLLCVCKGAIRVEKSTNGEDADKAEDAPVLKVGDSVTWEYKVENPSNLKVCNIKLIDDKEGNINCPSTCLDAHTDMTCTKEGIVKEGAYTNEATVTGTVEDNNRTVKDKDPSNYYGGVTKIDIEKHTNGKDSDTGSGEKLGVGDKVTWEYIVTNQGNIELTDIYVTDDKEGKISCPQTSLEAGESMTCTKDGIVKEGSYENEATATAKDPQGNETIDKDKSHYTGVSACIGNFMWLDENLNGVQDAGEPGVVNIKVELYNATTNTLVATTKTDSSGKYMFCNLKPGKYKVKFEQPNTYLFTLKDKGSDVKDSDVSKSGWSHVIDLEAGEKDLTIDAGIYCECDDYEVNPDSYTKQSASISFVSSLALLLFVILATSTLKYKKD